MFRLLQSAEFYKRREYHEKRSVLVIRSFFLSLLILVTKNSKRTFRITSICMVYAAVRLDIRSAYVY